MVNVFGKNQVATHELGIVTYCVVYEVAHDCVIGYPELLAANSVINAPENTLIIWKGKKLSLISYIFKDHINIHFVDWKGDIKT